MKCAEKVESDLGPLVAKHKDDLSKESLETVKTHEPKDFDAEAERRADAEQKRLDQKGRRDE